MRDYDPTTGRYIQADPLGLVDGASVYGYARGNPGKYVDPRGEEAGVVIWGGAGSGGSSFGHASAYVDDRVYTFGPGCAPNVCEIDRDEYGEANSFRRGTEYKLDFNSMEEYLFEQCLRREAGEYGAFKNNCTDPIEKCLGDLSYPVGDSMFPSSLGKSLEELDRVVREKKELPQSRPADGWNAPWVK